VFQSVRYSRAQGNARYLLNEQIRAVVVTDQCASYNGSILIAISSAWLMCNATCNRWRITRAKA
jgi:hypothetical protein